MQAAMWYALGGAYLMVIVVGTVFIYRIVRGVRETREAEKIPWRVRLHTGRLRTGWLRTGRLTGRLHR